MDLLIAIVVVFLFLILEFGGAAADILTINKGISLKALAGCLLAILIVYLALVGSDFLRSFLPQKAFAKGPGRSSHKMS